MALAGMSTSFSIPCPPSVGMTVMLMRSEYVWGLKMLSRVAHVVPFAPGVLPAAGMTYVSLICAAMGNERSVRRRETKMYLEAFTVKPFRVPATMGTAGKGGGIPAFKGEGSFFLRPSPFGFPLAARPLPACR